MKKIKLLLLLMLSLAIVISSLTSCEQLEELGIKLPFINDEEVNADEQPTPDEQPEELPEEDKKPEEEPITNEELWKTQYETITVADALTMCEDFVASPSTDRYYIIATVKSVDNASYGQLTIEDETGSIMVYGTNSADGSLKYDKMGVELKPGDVILIYGTLQNYKGNTKEVQNAWLIDYYTPDNQTPSEEPKVTITPDTYITVAEALANAALVNETDRYYITATVKSIKNPSYGEMYIEDATGEIYVYGSYNQDGSIGYANMEDKPYAGDTVTLYVTINVFNGTAQVKNARIISFTHNEIEVNEDDYTEMSVADARNTAKGTTVKVHGVVAAITYANGYVPSGFYLVDGTNSIYVYDGQTAARVAVGNTVTVYAQKDFWILETESTNANKFGYEGCNQLTNVVKFENDEGKTDFDRSWITATTVKEIMDTPVSENITTTIFKVTALIKRVDGNGFINYYIDDIDGKTGSYVYTQCNGGDFSWLDQYDGKFCTVYLSVINAKSTASGCAWRFFPIAVVDEGYTFDVNNAPKYAVTYHGLTQFMSTYTGDPALLLETLVSSELLGFEGATLSYSSSNEDILYFTNENGTVTFHSKKAGTATVTVTATHNGNTYSASMEITIAENVTVDYITVADAIATPYDTDVTVKGIVGPSLVNRDGFYLFGEDGSMIAVLITKDQFEGLKIGHEIIISGMRERFIKDDTYTTYGQDAIVNGQIIANYYGNHEYSTEKFITGKTLADIKALDVTESHSTEVYVVKATVEVVETAYYTNLKIVYNGVELQLYCSGAGQYSWLFDYAGQEITMEIAPCNWNDKKDNYRGCVLAIVLEDGSKIYNTLNFESN